MAAFWNSLSDQVQRNPVRSAFLILLVYVAWFVVPDIINKTIPGAGDDAINIQKMLGDFLPETILAVSVMVFAALYKDWKGLRITSRLRPFWWLVLLAPFLYLGFFMLMTGITVLSAGEAGLNLFKPRIFLSLVTVTLLVGIYEEFLFRGIIFHALEKWRGPILAAVVSSLVFGMMHYVNWIDGQSFTTTSYQVLHAAGSGFLYAGVMLMTGSIWPAVLIHGAWDNVVTYFQSALYLSQGDGDASAPAGMAAAATEIAASGDAAEPFSQSLIMGFEPIYGIILIAIYVWQQRRRKEA